MIQDKSLDQIYFDDKPIIVIDDKPTRPLFRHEIQENFDLVLIPP